MLINSERGSRSTPAASARDRAAISERSQPRLGLGCVRSATRDDVGQHSSGLCECFPGLATGLSGGRNPASLICPRSTLWQRCFAGRSRDQSSSSHYANWSAASMYQADEPQSSWTRYTPCMTPRRRGYLARPPQNRQNRDGTVGVAVGLVSTSWMRVTSWSSSSPQGPDGSPRWQGRLQI